MLAGGQCQHQLSNMTNFNSHIITVNNISYMLATFVAVFTLDRVGRRATLFWGSVFQAIGLFLAVIIPDIYCKDCTDQSIVGSVLSTCLGSPGEGAPVRWCRHFFRLPLHLYLWSYLVDSALAM
jgi:MFS family permease